MTYPDANFTSVLGWFQYNNAIVGNALFGRWMLIMVFFVSFIAFKIGFEMEKAFAAAMFITTLSSLMLWVSDLIFPSDVLVCVVLAAIGFIMLYLSSNSN